MFKKLLTLFNFLLLPQIVWRNHTLLWQLTKRSTLVRYKGSFLGLLWSFVHPLVMLCVYTFVFSWLMGAKWGVEGSDWGLGIADSKTAFAIIMLCGLTVFNLFTESVNVCSTVVVSSPNYVKKVIFPLEVLPVSQVLSSFILGAAWVVILFLGAAFVFGRLSVTMLLLPLVLLPLFCLTMGFSLFVASLGVYLRDTQYLVTIVTQLLFWSIPIVYPVKLLHDKLGKCEPWVATTLTCLVEWNPLSVVVEQTRRVFLYGQLPEWQSLGLVILGSLVVLQAGTFFFCRTKKGFADVL